MTLVFVIINFHYAPEGDHILQRSEGSGDGFQIPRDL